MRAVINRVDPINTYKPLDPSIYRISAELDKLQVASNKPIKEVKDKDGFTSKQNAEIHKYLTRPKAKPMPITKYIDRINRLYGNDPAPTKQGMKDLR